MGKTKYDWEKWGMDFWKSLATHIADAGLSWLSLNGAHSLGITAIPSLEWRALLMMLAISGLLRTVFEFLKAQPAPAVIVESTTETSTVTKTKVAGVAPAPVLPTPPVSEAASPANPPPNP